MTQARNVSVHFLFVHFVASKIKTIKFQWVTRLYDKNKK